MQEYLYSITNPTGCTGNVNYVNPYPEEKKPEPAVRLSTSCALFQVRYEDYILTGPIVLRGEAANLEVIAYPTSVNVEFLNASGQVIAQPVEGEPFFVRVPATSSTYMVSLYAIVDQCTGNAGGTYTGATAPYSPYAQPSYLTAQEAIGSILYYAGSLPQPTPVETMYPLPDCYVLYAQLNFYINPKPVKCCPSDSCIDLPLSDGSSACDDAFYVHCCHCRDFY